MNEQSAAVVARGKLLPDVLPALVCVCLLLAAVFGRWPYSFYMLLRITTCAACFYLCSRVVMAERPGIWAWILGAIAVAYNPLIPLRMSRADWRVLNLITCILLAAWSKAGMRCVSIVPFNRASSLPWWFAGRILRRRHFSLLQVKTVNWITPLVRRVERYLPLPALSLIATFEKVLPAGQSQPEVSCRSSVPGPALATLNHCCTC